MNVTHRHVSGPLQKHLYDFSPLPPEISSPVFLFCEPLSCAQPLSAVYTPFSGEPCDDKCYYPHFERLLRLLTCVALTAGLEWAQICAPHSGGAPSFPPSAPDSNLLTEASPA